MTTFHFCVVFLFPFVMRPFVNLFCRRFLVGLVLFSGQPVGNGRVMIEGAPEKLHLLKDLRRQG